jgi:hypothetical protein
MKSRHHLLPKTVAPYDGQGYQQQQRQLDRHESNTEPGVRRLFSRLNCCRTNQNCAATIAKADSGSSMDHSLHGLPEGEAEELRWLAYSMQPIAEDQSHASNSVISMSAPLLSPPAVLEIIHENSHLSKSAGAFPNPTQDQQRTSRKGVDRNSYEYGRSAMYEF